MSTSSQHIPSNGWTIYKRLIRYALADWRFLLFAVIAMAVVAATEPAFAAMMKPLLDGSFVEKDPEVIAWVPLAILGIFALRGTAMFVTTYAMAYVGRRVVFKLRRAVFAHMLDLPTSFYDHSSSGRLISRLTYDVEQVAQASTEGLTVLVRDTLSILGLLAWMAYISWQLTLAFLIIGPFIALALNVVSKRFRKLSRRIQSSMGDVTQAAEEMVKGHEVIKIFGGQGYETQRFEKVNEHNRRLQMKISLVNAINEPVLQILVASAVALIVFIATREAVLAEISVGSFMSFMMAMLMLSPPIKRLTKVNMVLQKGIAAGESVFGLLDAAKETDAGQHESERVAGRLRFKNVNFVYPNTEKAVLHDISFEVAAKTTTALVGLSGSGKTTIASLLPRFYSVEQGEVLLDEVNLKDYRLSSLRDQIAYVGQHVVLFNDSIAANISYGCADWTPESLRQAAIAAHALEFIEALPNGFDTLIGDNGVLLSGGQRQRLAIARAILKDAPILILDEATSALDTEAERHIQAALQTLQQGRTTLVIAHRLSTVENAEQILVLSQGKILQRGTHQSLLAEGGQYAKLYQMQFNDHEINL